MPAGERQSSAPEDGRPIVFFGAGGGGALALLMLVTIVWMFWRSSTTLVASADTEEPKRRGVRLAHTAQTRKSRKFRRSCSRRLR